MQKPKYFINQLVDFAYVEGAVSAMGGTGTVTTKLSGKIVEVAMMRRSLLDDPKHPEYGYKIITFGKAPSPVMWVVENEIIRGGKIVRSIGPRRKEVQDGTPVVRTDRGSGPDIRSSHAE